MPGTDAPRIENVPATALLLARERIAEIEATLAYVANWADKRVAEGDRYGGNPYAAKLWRSTLLGIRNKARKALNGAERTDG